MDVWHTVLRFSGRTRLCEGVPLADACATLHQQRTEVGQRCLVPVVRRDRHGQAVGRYLPGECDLTGDRRQHTSRIAESDVHTAVLPTRIAIVRDGELAEDRPIRGPRPRPRGGSPSERPRHRSCADDQPPRCPASEHGSTVAPDARGGNAIDELVTESRGLVTESCDRARSWTSRSASRRRLPPAGVAGRQRRARPRPPAPDPVPRPSTRCPAAHRARS